MSVVKVGVIIDAWKLSTFEDLFGEHKFAYEQEPGETSESLTLRVAIEESDVYKLQAVVQEANETARRRANQKVGVEEPTSLTYEVWSTETNRLMGTIELKAHPSLEHKARVTCKLKKGHVTDLAGKAYNAFELLVCQMDNRDDQKRVTRRYWALETNLPLHIAKHLEGFTPKIERPSLSQMFFLQRHKTPIVTKK